MKKCVCFAFVVVCLFHWQSKLLVSAQDRIRYVDSDSGIDSGNCTENMPCKTLNYGVYGNAITDRGYFDCNVSLHYANNSVIMVSNGTYKMADYGLVLCEVSDITIQAVNPGGAVVQCECFNCAIEDAMFGNIYLQRAKNITFEGMVFERCGYNASNVFVRTTEGLTFKSCTFR